MCWTTTGTPTYHFFFFVRKSSDKLKIYINKSVFMKKRGKIMKGFWIFYVLEAMTCLMH